MDAKQATTVQMTLRDAPNKISFSPSGVYGSNNFQAQIVAEFFIEKRVPATPFQLTLNPANNSVTEIHKAEQQVTMVREVHATLLFNPDMAEAVGKWLLAQAAQLRSQTQGVSPITPKSVVQ